MSRAHVCECVCTYPHVWTQGSPFPCPRSCPCASCLLDDTGCPSSQSVSPVKTPSDTGNSPISFCPGSDEDFTRKKCTTGVVGEGSIQSARYKKELKSGLGKPGKCMTLQVCDPACPVTQGSPILHPIPQNIVIKGECGRRGKSCL